MTAQDDGVKHDIAAERERRGLSVREAARRGGVSNTTWSRYEAGDTPLTGKMRLAVAEAFGWSTDWPETEQPATTAPAPTDDVAEVLELARSMREGLTKSQSRDAKLDEIIALCRDLSEHIGDLTATAVDARDRAERNEAALAALVAHFGLSADL